MFVQVNQHMAESFIGITKPPRPSRALVTDPVRPSQGFSYKPSKLSSLFIGSIPTLGMVLERVPENSID